MTYCLMVLVQIQMTTRNWERAAHLLGAAQAIGDSVSTKIDTRTAAEHGATIREHLSPERFTAAWTAGHALSFEQAVATAQALTPSALPEAVTA